MSTILFATEPQAVGNLSREGVSTDRVHLVGNLMIDALARNLRKILDCGAANRLGLESRAYGVATLHRPCNVDSESSLRQMLALLQEAATRGPVVFPTHPRTIRNLARFDLHEAFQSTKGIKMIDPLGYMDFMNVVLNARYVLTDSGGLQAETTWLGIPCLTLRDRTEHLLTVQHGTNSLCNLELDRVRDGLDRACSFSRSHYRPPALWDGCAAHRIAKVLVGFLDGTTKEVATTLADGKLNDTK